MKYLTRHKLTFLSTGFFNSITDEIGRMNDWVFTAIYRYFSGENYTSSQVESMQYHINNEVKYEYFEWELKQNFSDILRQDLKSILDSLTSHEKYGKINHLHH